MVEVEKWNAEHLMHVLWKDRPQCFQLLVIKQQKFLLQSQDAQTWLLNLGATFHERSNIRSEYGLFLFRSQDARTWLLDSNGSFHVTPRKEWFLNYSIGVGSVRLSNRHECQIGETREIPIWLPKWKSDHSAPSLACTQSEKSSYLLQHASRRWVQDATQ